MSHAFLATIKDPPLRRAIRTVLLELSMLAEAPAVNLEPSVAGSKSTDRAPRQAFKSRTEDLSLHLYYAQKFENACPDPHRLQAVLLEAQRELEWTRKGIPMDRLILQAERDEARDTQLLIEQGEGIHAAVLRSQHDWPIGWIRTTRERNGRDPDYGKPRPRWRDTPDEERYRICAEMASEGLTQSAGAKRLGVAQPTVNKYWPKRVKRVA